MPRHVDLGSREEDAPAIFAPGGGQFSSSGAFPSVLLPVVWETCRKVSLAFRIRCLFPSLSVLRSRESAAGAACVPRRRLSMAPVNSQTLSEGLSLNHQRDAQRLELGVRGEVRHSANAGVDKRSSSPLWRFLALSQRLPCNNSLERFQTRGREVPLGRTWVLSTIVHLLQR